MASGQGRSHAPQAMAMGVATGRKTESERDKSRRTWKRGRKRGIRNGWKNGPEMDENNAAKYSRIAQAELLSEAWKAIAILHPNQQWQRTAARSAQTL